MPTVHQIALDKNFVNLDRYLSEFNIFQATDMGRREIKHTKFLAYLLSPGQAHGLGVRFLTEFLRSAFSDQSNFDLLDLILFNASVRAEVSLGVGCGRIDIILEIPKSDGDPYLIAIENKLAANQGGNQLETYREAINQKFPKRTIFLLYLTQTMETPNDDGWLPVLHEVTTISAIDSLLNENDGETISEYMKFILNDYKKILKTEEVDENLDKLVTLIPKEYIDGIRTGVIQNLEKLNFAFPNAYRYLKSFDSDYRLEILRWFKGLSVDNVSIEKSDRTRLRLSILTDDNKNKLREICKETEIEWLANKDNIAVEFNLKKLSNHRVSFYSKIVLGPTNSGFQDRNNFRVYLRNKFNQINSDRESNLYSTIYREPSVDCGSAEVAKGKIEFFIKRYASLEAGGIREKLNLAVSEFFKKSAATC